MATKTEKDGDLTEEKINTNKQWPQWLAVLSASLNFFSAGICFCWSSPSLAILQSDKSPFPITNDQSSWIAAFLPIGCAFGPILGSYLSRYLGPKHSTIISAFPYLAGFVLIIFATGPTWLYVSRFLSGIGVGFGQTAAPIYVAEIAENHNRGALMSFFVLWMAVGGFFVSCIGPYVSLQTMAEISAIFPVLLLATMLLVPDSPYYLMRIGKEEKAIKSLKWLRRQKNDMIIHEELKCVKKMSMDNFSTLECIKHMKETPNPKALAIVNVTYFAQQICGAVVVVFYQEQIYEISKVPIRPEVAVIMSSFIGNLAGILSVLFVDRWGRKPLLLISTLGCGLSTGLLGTYLFLDERNALGPVEYVNWIPIVALNALQVFFAFGLSPVPSTQVGEFFSSNVKEIAFCLLSVLAALEGFIITKLFQIVKDSYGLPTVFWGLSALTLTTLVFMYWKVPETKGKSFLEIQNMLMTPDDSIEDDMKLQEIKRY
ncbi:facilitated trehalose transporter Tret1-like [Arctopsyche grandis]|uniref:facilitated trehalose transporter Tret1-like n=1 Tax=Arctopsyche grandis TaxID=121162 RepID=UPI00406DA1A3